MNYFAFFGLTEHPFQVTPDSRFLYLSSAHAQAIAYMEYSVWKRDGFAVITGEIGSGKTILIHRLLSELDSATTVIQISQTQLTEIEFLQIMLVELGFSADEFQGDQKVNMLHKLKTYFTDASKRGQHVVLIVDEAQNLSRTVLEEIRMLTTPEPGRGQVLNIILVGQPELKDTLNRPDMEQLSQRIRLRFHVEPLSESEAVEFIKHRLKVGGLGDKPLFLDDSYPEIYRYTGGVPRRINILCDTALRCAFADEQNQIGKQIIEEAVTELQWRPFEEMQKERWKHADGLQSSPATLTDCQSSSGSMQAPSFTAGNQEWSHLFSMVLNTMTDVNRRMGRLEDALDRFAEHVSMLRGEQVQGGSTGPELIAAKSGEDTRPTLVDLVDAKDDKSVS